MYVVAAKKFGLKYSTRLDLHVSTFPCISHCSDGVDEGIEWIVQCVKRNSMERPPTLKDIT